MKDNQKQIVKILTNKKSKERLKRNKQETTLEFGMNRLCSFLLSFVLIVSLVSEGFCSAEFLKEVEGYQAGDGFIFYFVLGDKKGFETVSNGRATLEIVCLDEKILYSKTVNVGKKDFQRVIVGEGFLQREALVYLFDRVPLDELKWPEGNKVTMEEIYLWGSIFELQFRIKFQTPTGKVLEKGDLITIEGGYPRETDYHYYY